MKIQINITKEVLERSSMCGRNGEQINSNCAIALAVREIMPQAHVTGWFIVPTDELYNEFDKKYTTSMRCVQGDERVINLPETAMNFISKFDCKSPEFRVQMDEISFEIDVPNEVIDMIGLSEVYRVLSESKTLELVKI